MENPSILIDFQVELADRLAERRAAIAMADERLPGSRRITLSGDKATTPATSLLFVARSESRRMWRRTTRERVVPRSTRTSQRIRKQIEEAFGPMKTIGACAKSATAAARVQMHAYMVAAASNLIRIGRLGPAPA